MVSGSPNFGGIELLKVKAGNALKIVLQRSVSFLEKGTGKNHV